MTCGVCGRIPFEERGPASLGEALCFVQGDDHCRAVAAKIRWAKGRGAAAVPVLRREIEFLERRVRAGLRGLEEHVFRLSCTTFIVNAIHTNAYAHHAYLAARLERARCALEALGGASVHGEHGVERR
jgi:hypothetical protein